MCVCVCVCVCVRARVCMHAFVHVCVHCVYNFKNKTKTLWDFVWICSGSLLKRHILSRWASIQNQVIQVHCFVSILGQKCCQLCSVLSVSFWTWLWSTGFINKGSQRVNTAPEWSEVFPATDVCLWYRRCQVILITCRQILQHYTALVLTIILMHCGGSPQDKSDGEQTQGTGTVQKHCVW